jgi:flagellar hook protein FlgE
MSLIGTLDSGVSALRTFMKGLDVIGNNIANVDTTAFKSASAQYQDSFSNILQRSSPSSGSSSNTDVIGVGTGVSLAGITSDFSQGSLQSTGKPTDLGISGNGYFIVKNPADGSVYATRAGDFRWDDNGNLVTQQGFFVQGSNGNITLGTPPAGAQLSSVAIDKSGNVVESYSDGTTATNNQVLLQNFSDQGALTSEGNNLFSGFDAAGPLSTSLATATNTPGTSGLGEIQAGTLELSNVDLTDQFSDLITTQRSFEAGSRLLTVSDTVLEDIVNLKTR